MVDTPDSDPLTVTRTSPPESVREYDELLSSLQRQTGMGIWLYDVSTRGLWWSESAKRIHGISEEEHLTFADVVKRYVDDDRDRVMQQFVTAIEDQEPFTVDVGLSGEGTTERSLRLHCEPETEGGKTIVLRGVVEDVTNSKRREQRIEILRRTSQELRGAGSKQEVAEILANTAKNILGLVNTTVRLIDEDRTTLRTFVATEECVERAGDRPDYPVTEDTPAVRVYRSGEPEIHPDHEHTEDDNDRGELRSGLYVPIGDHGVLSAGDIVVNAFEDHDLEAAGLLGQLGAEAITRIGWVNRSRAV